MAEIGIFVVPAVLAILALRWAERKAKRAAAEKESASNMESVITEDSASGE